MDKTKLFEMLVSQYDYSEPDAITNKDIITFIQQYGMTDLQKLVDYSLSASESVEIGYSVNQILGAMPDSNNMIMLSGILENHPNADVRYNVAYIISKYNNEAAFNVMTNIIAIEKNDSVIGNVIAGAIKLAGVDSNKILLVFNTYNGLSDSHKSRYTSMLLSVTFDDESLKAAWKLFLETKVNEGTNQDKENAKEIKDYVFRGR